MAGFRTGRWPFGKISDKKKNTNPLEQPRIKNSTSTEHSNNSNINSNNTHTTIGGNGPNFVFKFITENRSDSDTQVAQQGSSDMPLPTSHNQPEPSVILPTNKLTNSRSDASYMWQPPSASTSQASNFTPHTQQTPANIELDEDDDDVLSALPRSVNPLPKVIKCSESGKYVPKGTEEYIKRYMRTKLFDLDFIIPLFSPSKVPARAKNVCIGNVGFFNDLGGFTTLFNIFETKSQNLALGYNPPSGFRPFYKTFSQLSIDIQRSEPPKHWSYFGFEADPEDEMTLWPPTKNTVDCAAIYMANGYSRQLLERQDEMEIQDYLCDEQPRWQSHFDQNSPSQFRDLSFAVILGCYRAETWTFATGTKEPRDVRKEKIILQELVQHQGCNRYIWKTNGRSIRCEYGPTNDQLDQLEQYLSDETVALNLDAEGRRDIRECHCVAVRVCVLRKPKWRLGASISSARSSKSTIKQHFARGLRSMPSIPRY